MSYMEPDRGMHVEFVYALPAAQEVLELELPEGVTIRRALELSGLLGRHPDIDGNKLALGVYGRPAAGDLILKDGDRVEIYRPLVADPKQARRRRAARAR
jgi:putative ubiquitin-RnfH superfamily antitoxin RatB of RatAB toxin-antitoxin module